MAQPKSAYFGTDEPESLPGPPPPQRGPITATAPPPPDPNLAPSPSEPQDSLMAKAGVAGEPDLGAPPEERGMLLQKLAQYAATDSEMELIDVLAESWGVPSPFGDSYGPQEGMDQLQMERGAANASPETAPIADQVDPQAGADLRFYPDGRGGMN